MKIEYAIGVDGWIEHPRGRVEISNDAWEVLSKGDFPPRNIPCRLGLCDSQHIEDLSRLIDDQLKKNSDHKREKTA